MIDLFFPVIPRRSGRCIVQEESKAARKKRQQREACARWRAKNPDKIKRLNAARKEKYDMYAMVKEWRAANPEKWHGQAMRRSAKLKRMRAE